LYGQLVLEKDARAILNVDPQFASVSDYDGYEKVFSFLGQNAALYTSGIALPTMLKYDIKGNDTTGLKYLGAFAKQA
jgi:hypothetical protein